MAGYNGYSKSNNALRAEHEGKLPASRFAAWLRRYIPGVTTADVKAILRPSEWHHTSCKYNQTDYYDRRDLLNLETRREFRGEIARRNQVARENAERDAREAAENARWREETTARYGSLEAYWKMKGR